MLFEDKLGGYFPKENKQLEFKEFCLKTPLDIYISPQEAEEILEKQIWNPKLQPVIIKNLHIYIDSFLPKYICSFINTNINGTFYMGINDYGEITGIPFMYQMKQEFIVDLIKDTIMKNIKQRRNESIQQLNETLVEKILSNINCSIELLEIDNILIDDENSKLYEKYKKDLIETNDRQLKYNNERVKWLLNLTKYSTKLKDILNTTETRKEMIEYMYDNGIKEDNDMITTLKKNTYITIPDYDNLQQQKINKNDIMYWLVKFKDYMTNKTVLQRPEKPLPIKMYTPYKIIQKLSLIRNILINDKRVNYYLIKITVNGENIKDQLYYKNYGEWIFRKREEQEDGSPYSY